MVSFSSNCTLPPEGVGFVRGPKVRGTLDIWWSCLATLVICTWSILHLNIPEQSTPETMLQTWKRSSVRLCYKIKWMLANLLAPEWALGKAFSDYCSVRYTDQRFKRYAHEDMDNVPWSKAHTHFANMGGFVIKFTPLADTPALIPRHANSQSERSLSTADQGIARPESDSRGPPARLPPAVSIRDPLHSTETTENGSHNASFQLSTLSPDLSRAYATTPEGIDPPPHTVDDEESVNCVNSLTGHELTTIQYQRDKARDEVNRTGELTEVKKIPSRWRRWLSVNRFPGEEVRDKRSTERSWIGPLDWKLDNTNIRTVEQASQLVHSFSYQFAHATEEDRFRFDPKGWSGNAAALKSSHWSLDAHQLLLARSSGLISTLPHLSDDQLADRNKGDAFIKCITLGHVLWFAAQTIARLTHHLHTTQLEILTLAFAACTFFTYILLLDKPKDVQTPFILPASRYPSPEEIIRLAVVGPSGWPATRDGVRVPNHAVHMTAWSSAPLRPVQLGGCFSLVIFGAVHALAWNYVFPTRTEKMLWHITTVITMGVVPAGLALRWGLDRLSDVVESCWVSERRVSSVGIWWVFRSLDGVVVAATVVSFCMARLFVMVEVLRSLAFLPPGAFVATWVRDWPHLG